MQLILGTRVLPFSLYYTDIISAAVLAVSAARLTGGGAVADGRGRSFGQMGGGC